jgi:hypothetical protein
MPIDKDFALVPIPAIPDPPHLHALPNALGVNAALLPPPLGALAGLRGTWKGNGFNQIWRPFHPTGGQPPTQDRFLELNLTHETLEFTEIPGEIPNRGLLQPDIKLFGLTYLQQVQDANVKGPNGQPAGIHIEPGIWIKVPATTDPSDPISMARLATIPHGTSILAQGTSSVIAGPPHFAVADITPFLIGQPTNLIHFPESNLGIPTPFRSPPADIVGITQAMVDNPNVVLRAGLTGKTVTSTTTLHISTSTTAVPVPSTGGGNANIAFLVGATGGPNAVSAQVDATFWIEAYTLPGNPTVHHQLQYTQRVLLNFNKLSWPHISVATLQKVA